jgi:hypothetical protein
MGLSAAAFLLLPAFFPACGPRFDNRNIKVLNDEFDRAEAASKKGLRDPGLSPTEVQSVLGPPRRVETTRLPLETQKKEVAVTRYYYEQDGQTLELHFFDNRLIARIPRLKDGTEPAATPAAKKEEPAAAPLLPPEENPANAAPLPDK